MRDWEREGKEEVLEEEKGKEEDAEGKEAREKGSGRLGERRGRESS